MMSDTNPFLEGYKSAILGRGNLCPYEQDSAEYERWARGFGGEVVTQVVAAAVSVAIPVLEGRRPFVEGYRAAIFGGRETCAYEEGTAEYERWYKGFRGWTGGGKTQITTPFLEGRRPFVDGYKAAILGRAAQDAPPEYKEWGKAKPWWTKTESRQADCR